LTVAGRRTGRRQDRDRALAAQARTAALVVAVAMVAWMGVQWLGGRLGWEARVAFLFDLAALAAFLWAMVVTWRVWRSGREQ
jgi:high-affinity Fe2+/Pb2+ permease